jgi:hypothetical protein
MSDPVEFYAAEKLAENLHPVANPAFDHDNGAIFTTLSGTRGQEVPISVYKITPDGQMQPFLPTSPTRRASHSIRRDNSSLPVATMGTSTAYRPSKKPKRSHRTSE